MELKVRSNECTMHRGKNRARYVPSMWPEHISLSMSGGQHGELRAKHEVEQSPFASLFNDPNPGPTAARPFLRAQHVHHLLAAHRAT